MSIINRNHDHGHGGAAGYSMTKSINAFHQRAMVHEITGPIALPHALLTAYREPEIDMFLKGNERLSPHSGVGFILSGGYITSLLKVHESHFFTDIRD